jgi:phosphoenolpyruvate carboxykinase (ATP)
MMMMMFSPVCEPAMQRQNNHPLGQVLHAVLWEEAAANAVRYVQLAPEVLTEHAVKRQEGVIASNGALATLTGEYTGRSPQDRFIVQRGTADKDVNWGKVNRPITPESFERILNKALDYLKNHDIYLQDAFCGADAQNRLRVRFLHTKACQAVFTHDMFVRPNAYELERFQVDWHVLAVPGLELDPATDGVRSEVGVIVDFETRCVIVAGTHYAGEIKKSMFSVMNYQLPEQDILPMHCSANVDDRGNSALFFGLSGTGKTTLSAHPGRLLIGDDEHGWGASGIFNMEGGCYAKTHKLSEVFEPDIYHAIRPGAIMENVKLNAEGVPDYDDATITENGRVAYPVHFIPNAVIEGKAGHPNTVIFLTADAFGVLPPISKLLLPQTQYHFLSGYTSKLAGTERGIKEPQATFSACFGGPFMPKHPKVYAELLANKVVAQGTRVYLINTGWQGGGYGVGERLSIPDTRLLVQAALTGALEETSFRVDPVFNLLVPTSCMGLDAHILDPKKQWKDPDAYDATAKDLAGRFKRHFQETYPELAELAQQGGPF